MTKRFWLFALSAALLMSACQPAQDPMPMVVAVYADGTITVQFPWCAGDRVSAAGLVASEDRVMRMQSQGDPPAGDSVVTMTISTTTWGTGQLTPDLAVTHQLPRLTAYDPADVARIFVYTADYEASTEMSKLREIGGDVWLVTGAEGQRESTISQSDLSVGLDVLTDFCADEPQ